MNQYDELDNSLKKKLVPNQLACDEVMKDIESLLKDEYDQLDDTLSTDPNYFSNGIYISHDLYNELQQWK